jgi:hypothetical protein
MKEYQHLFPIALIVWMAINYGIMAARIGKEITIRWYNWITSVLWYVLLYFCGFFDVFNWPQITYVVLVAFGLGCSLVNNKTKLTVWTFLVSLGLTLFLYIKGGAFKYL